MALMTNFNNDVMLIAELALDNPVFTDLDYNNNSNHHLLIAEALMDEHNLSGKDIDAVSTARRLVQDRITSRYGVKFDHKDTWRGDHQQVLTDAGVPTRMRLELGLINTILGHLMAIQTLDELRSWTNAWVDKRYAVKNKSEAV